MPASPSAGASSTSCSSPAPRPCTPAPWPAVIPAAARLAWAEPARRARRRQSLFGVEKPGATDLEMQRGVLLPIHAYPLVRERPARRQRLDPAEHAARIGALWSRFSQVAAGNPHAWIRTARTADGDRHPGPGQPHGLVSLPQAVHGEHAGRPGRRVHRVLGGGGPRPPACPRSAGSSPWPAPTATTTGSSRDRPELHRSPAIRLAGAAALELAGLGIDDVAFVDLYSCFPVVVQMAAARARAGRSTIPTAR